MIGIGINNIKFGSKHKEESGKGCDEKNHSGNNKQSFNFTLKRQDNRKA